MKTLVKNGMIVSPEDTYEADVLIEDGVIECIGKNLEAKFGDADKVIDAKGKYVLPGGIDVHTHMDIDVGIARAVDDFYTGLVLLHPHAAELQQSYTIWDSDRQDAHYIINWMYIMDWRMIKLLSIMDSME